jgi:uncharacterized damage-inducible protein DinB
MESALRSIFRHNAWANQRLLSHLGELTEEQLTATTSAVYGGVLATMHHIISGEASYWSFFSGRMPSWFQPESVPATLPQLLVWERDLAVCWETTPLDEIDGDAPVERTRRDGSVTRLKAGIVIAQAIHHGNVHREQVSHILTDLKIEVPDLSLYAYAREAGE